MEQPTNEQREQWAKELCEAYLKFFNSDEGKLILADLMKHYHIYDSTFVSGSAHETVMQEGERRVVLHILNRCGNAVHNPLSFIGARQTMYQQQDPFNRIRSDQS